MPYDICDDEATLDVIETEMANSGITQEYIDERRSEPERKMLNDMKALHQAGVAIKDERNERDGSTYVSKPSEITYVSLRPDSTCPAANVALVLVTRCGR